MPRGAAGDDRDPLDCCQRKRQFGQVHGAGRRVDQRVDRVADHRRLLENLLLHEMAIIALADQGARGGGFADRPFDLVVGGIEDRHRARGHDRPIAFFEIGDAAGQGRQRQGVRAQKHLAVAIADRQRAAAARADQQIVLAGEQKGEREGAIEPRQASGPPPAAATTLRRGNGSPGSPPPRCRSGSERRGPGLRARAATPGNSR